MQTTRVTLTDTWKRLRAVRRLRFLARSRNRACGCNGEGAGQVEVTVIGDSSLTFTERGTWVVESGRQLDFNNAYRWTFDRDVGTVRLEHLRYDPAQPVFLLELAPTDESGFESISPHRCGEDVYAATVRFADDAVDLRWSVKGPKKDAVIRCTYEM